MTAVPRGGGEPAPATGRGRHELPRASVDRLYEQILVHAHDRVLLRRLLNDASPDDLTLLGLLRRPLPRTLLEHLATDPGWGERPRVLAGVALHRTTPVALALRIVPSLFWRDLAEVALKPALSPALRGRAEALLLEQLGRLRKGDRVELARMAPPKVAAALVLDPDERVQRAALVNPRLREADLLALVGGASAPPVLLERIAGLSRFRDNYAVRLALVRQARTPLAVSLSLLSALVPRDWRDLRRDPRARPLLRAAAERLLEPPARDAAAGPAGPGTLEPPEPSGAPEPPTIDTSGEGP